MLSRTFAAALIAVSFVPVSDACGQASATVEAVDIPVSGGPSFSGRYRDAGVGSPGVLLFPMCSSSGHDGWTPVAEQLRKAGVSSLMMEEAGWNDREARADAALAYLRSRVGANAPIAVTGGSCGVALAAGAASRHPEQVRALVLLSGPHNDSDLEFVKKTSSLAVFSGASEGEPPSPEWARALKQASPNPASHVEIWTLAAHGTDYFFDKPAFAAQIAEWLVQVLKS